MQVATPPGPCRFLETRLRAGSCSRPRHVQCTWGARRRTTAGSYRLPLQGRIDRWYWGDTTVQVATPPTASEFRGGIIGVTLRPVSGADIVSLITDCSKCSSSLLRRRLPRRPLEVVRECPRKLRGMAPIQRTGYTSALLAPSKECWRGRRGPETWRSRALPLTWQKCYHKRKLPRGFAKTLSQLLQQLPEVLAR